MIRFTATELEEFVQHVRLRAVEETRSRELELKAELDRLKEKYGRLSAQLDIARARVPAGSSSPAALDEKDWNRGNEPGPRGSDE